MWTNHQKCIIVYLILQTQVTCTPLPASQPGCQEARQEEEKALAPQNGAQDEIVKTTSTVYANIICVIMCMQTSSV